MRNHRIRVAINGVGALGWSLAAAVGRQPDMELVGIRDLSVNGQVGRAARRGFGMYAIPATARHLAAPAIPVRRTFDELLSDVDVVVDCGPAGSGVRSLKRCRAAGVKVVLQGSESHAVTGHSFLAEVNYASAVGRPATRVVSSDTAALVRTLAALQRSGLLARGSGTLMRRPARRKGHGRGRPEAPTGCPAGGLAAEAHTVATDLNVTTVEIDAPHAQCQLQSWRVELTRPAARNEVVEVLRSAPRVAVVRMSDGVLAELMRDLGCVEGESGDVAIWEDLLAVEGREAFYTCQVFDEATVVRQNVDAIRALAGVVTDGRESIRLTDRSLGTRAWWASSVTDHEAAWRRQAFRLFRGPASADPGDGVQSA